MPAFESFQSLPWKFLQHFIFLDSEFLHHPFQEAICQDIYLPPHVDSRISKIRMQRNRQVSRDCPGCGGPDDDINGFPFQMGEDIADIPFILTIPLKVGGGGYHFEFHLDGGGTVVLIFHLCLSQCRLASGTPVDRFLSFVNRPVKKKLSELSHNRCLVFKIHGQIGILPLPKDPEAFELLSLNPYKFGGVIPASSPDFNGGEFSFLRTAALLHFVFNG